MRPLPKRHLFYALTLLVALGSVAAAQTPLRLPRLSQKATVNQTVGVTDVTITYSRPGVKSRAVWGQLVPYDQVWRAGANEATIFSVTDDVMINGQKLPAGTYSLHTIPSRSEWTVIFNRTADQWGSYQYDEKQDALRIRVKPQPAEHQELLTYEFPTVTPKSAQVALRWERLMVPFTIEVPDPNALTIEKARAAIASAKPDDWRTPLQAAVFALDNNISTEEAARWIDQSIRIKETYNNLSAKARLLAGAGKMQEAITTGERALQLGREAKANTTDLEKRLADWKSKKL